jgi:hypothetical protein
MTRKRVKASIFLTSIVGKTQVAKGHVSDEDSGVSEVRVSLHCPLRIRRTYLGFPPSDAPPTSVRGPVHEARRRPRIPQPTRVCTSNIDQLAPKLDGPFPSTLNAGTPTNLARTDEGKLNGAPLLVGIGIHHKPIFA